MVPTEPRIIVLSDTRDAHLPFVQVHLTEPMVVIDPLLIAAGTELSHYFHDGTLTTSYDNQPLKNVSGVWFRRPQPVKLDDAGVAEELKEHAISAITWHYEQLRTTFREAVWASDYYAMLRASNKMWQLEVASKLGFNVPDTVATSSAAVAKNFIGAHKRVIVKPMSSILPVIGNVRYGFYTTVLQKNALPDLRNLHLAPAIFQEAVDTDFDVRITVVGKKVFAASIHNAELGKDPTLLDWRPNQETPKLTIAPYTLTSVMKKRCIELVAALGLRTGAIDLVMDKRGKLWFLENNPNGQWAFVEVACGLPIGKAYAEFLAGKQG